MHLHLLVVFIDTINELISPTQLKYILFNYFLKIHLVSSCWISLGTDEFKCIVPIDASQPSPDVPTAKPLASRSILYRWVVDKFE